MIIAGILNGSNLNRDYHFSVISRALASFGVVTGDSTELEVQANLLKAGLCVVEATRDTVTPNEKVLVIVRVTSDEIIDTSGDGFIIIKLDDAKVNDGSSNASDGSGVGTVEKVASLPSKNFLELASLSSGVITDTRAYVSVSASAIAALTDYVGTAQLKDDAVTAIKILNGNVTTEKLEGGEASPTANKYYGTNGAAAKGFHALPEGSLKISKTAGAAISDGDPVGVDVDGRFRRAFDFEGEITEVIESGTILKTATAFLTDTRVAIAYERNNQVYSLCYDIETDGTVTMGAESLVANTDPQIIRLVRMSDTRYAIGFNSAANGTQICHTDVDGALDLTVNTVLTVDSTSSSSLDIGGHGSVTISVLYIDAAGDLRMKKYQTSGASWTSSTATLVVATGQNPSSWTIVVNSESSFGAVLVAQSLNTIATAWGFSVSGANPSIGSSGQSLSSNQTHSQGGYLKSSGVLCVKNDQTTELRFYTQSGDELTGIGSQSVNAFQSTDGTLRVIDGKYLLSIQRSGTDVQFVALKFSIPVDESEVVIEEEFTTIVTETLKSDVDFDVRRNRIAMSTTDNSGSAGRVFINDWILNVLGIAQAAVTKGNAFDVLLIGEDDAQSGLEVAEQYFVDEGAVLSKTTKFDDGAAVGFATGDMTIIAGVKNLS